MSFRGVTISYSPESPENIMHAIYNMYFYVVILCPMYAIFICILAQVFFKNTNAKWDSQNKWVPPD